MMALEFGRISVFKVFFVSLPLFSRERYGIDRLLIVDFRSYKIMKLKFQ